MKLGSESSFISGLEETKSAVARFAGDRDVVNDRDAQESLDVDIVRVRLEWIPEEDNCVDPALGDRCADLLISAELAAQEPVDW